MQLISGFNDPIKITWNVDANGDKISVGMQPESHIVVNGRITLIQIPDEFNGVQILEYLNPQDETTKVNEYDFYEVKDPYKSLEVNNFRVDYQSGIIQFHESLEAKSITVTKYYGRGVILTPASRIYSEIDESGDVKETIQDLIDTSLDTIDEFSDVVESIGDAEQIKQDLDMSIQQGISTDQDLNTTIQDAIAKDGELNLTINEAVDKDNTLNLTINDAIDKENTLLTTISDALDKNSVLGTTIEDADNKNTELNQTISNASNENDTLTQTISEATNKNTTLNQTIADSVSANSTLSDTITDSIDKNNALNQTIDNADTQDGILNTTISDAVDKDSILSTTIDDAIDKDNILNQTIDNAINENNTLQQTISEADGKDTDLSQTISEAISANSTLDSTINDSVTKNQDLTNTINTSIDKKGELEGTILSANTTNTTLINTIDDANVTKADLDDSIGLAEDTKDELDDYANIKKQELDTHTGVKKDDIDTYVGTKETELDQYTIAKEVELDDYTAIKMGELNTTIDNATIADDDLKETISNSETAKTNLQIKIDEGYDLLDDIEITGFETVEGAQTKADTAESNAKGYTDSHINDKNNPHEVNKGQIGLGNVENKSSETIRDEITSTNVTSALGYTPENKANKGSPGGYPSLNSEGIVPASQLPNNLKEIKVVNSISDRDNIANKFEGLRVHVKDASGDSTVESGWAEYLWDGNSWEKTAEKESIDVVLEWEDVLGKPNEFPPEQHQHNIGDVTGLQSALDSKETPSGAQNKADTAEQNAKDYTDIEIYNLPDPTWENLQNKPTNIETTDGAQQKANQAEQNAKDYTDQEISDLAGIGRTTETVKDVSDKIDVLSGNDLLEKANKTDLDSLITRIGNNEELNTEEKTKIILALNEVNTKATNTQQALTSHEADYASLFTTNADAKNSIYRGKYLGNTVTAEQYTAISSGAFTDMYIGDYWTISGINWRIAAFDYYYNTGAVAFTSHHVVIVPDTQLYTHVMNDTDITTGGYTGSKMYTEGLEQAKTTIKSAFGGHVVKHRQILSNATVDGKASGWAWVDSEVDLMNEIMVYGSVVWGESTIGGSGYNIGVGKSQLPLFRLNPRMINTRQSYWLRDVVSAAHFAAVSDIGYAISSNAGNARGVRPAFSIS